MKRFVLLFGAISVLRAQPSTAAPPQTAKPVAVQWVKVTVPELGVISAAVARPRGKGPFPALIILHGTHGFAEEYVQLAKDMARHGIVGVAACWFSGGGGLGARFVTPIPCSEAPAMPGPRSPAAMRAVDAVVGAVRALPNVRRDRVALFGHSRGGGAALHYVLGGGAVQAVVLNSAGYPEELATRAGDVRVPLLILHGVADGPSDGGSAFTNVQMARNFEAALKRTGRTVEAAYYDGSHNSIFTDQAQYADEVRRIAAFLRRHLPR